MNTISVVKSFCNDVGLQLGKGYSESVYQEAICVCLRQSSVHYEKEVVVPIRFRDTFVGNSRADIVLPTDRIVIECKAIDGTLKHSHVPQLITYLNALSYDTGLLVNFNQSPSKNIVEIFAVSKANDTSYIIHSDTDSFIISTSGCVVKE